MSEPLHIWREAVTSAGSTIKEIVSNLNRLGIRIVLVVTKNQELIGTVSDGDVRRGLLRGLTIDSPVTSVINRDPLVVSPGLERDVVMELMRINKIQQIPVVDQGNQLVGLHLWDEMITPVSRPNLMVIMAGGKGTRLLPYTEKCPKPMVRISGKPMLEHIIARAKLEGFKQFVLAIHHLGEMIEDYFGDGASFGVNIEYLREPTPMGTAGALSLLQSKPKSSFIVTNADVITDINYGDLLDFHLHHRASASMAVRAHEWQNPYGVVLTQGAEIVGFEEKPVVRNHVNAGVYVLSPDALNHLPSDIACDMPELFERLRAKSKTTVAYPLHELWLDVGSPDDLNKANLTTSKKNLTWKR